MDIFGIGPMEVLLILVIALIIMGPNDMVKTGRTIGKFLRQIVKSPTWQAVTQTSRDLRYLPNKLMREAGMEENVEEIKKISKDISQIGQVSLNEEINKVTKEIQQTGNDLSAWTTPPVIASPPPPTQATSSQSLTTPITTSSDPQAPSTSIEPNHAA